jgi:hypothetical protein
MTSTRWPKRKAHAELSTGASVSVYSFEDGGFGIEFTNSDGERTRCGVSKEGLNALVNCGQASLAGGGATFELEWVFVRDEVLEGYAALPSPQIRERSDGVATDCDSPCRFYVLFNIGYFCVHRNGRGRSSRRVLVAPLGF